MMLDKRRGAIKAPFLLVPLFVACLLSSYEMTGLATAAAAAAAAGSSMGRCGPSTGSAAVERSKEPLSSSDGFDVVVCEKHLSEYSTKLTHTVVDGADVAFPVFADPNAKPSASANADLSSSSKGSSDSSPAKSSSSDSTAPVQVAVGFIARVVVNSPTGKRHRRLLIIQGGAVEADVPTTADVAEVEAWLGDFAKNNGDLLVNGRDSITATSLRRRGTQPNEIFFRVYIITTEPDAVELRVQSLSFYTSAAGDTELSAPEPCGGFEGVAFFGEDENLEAQLASAPPADCPNLVLAPPAASVMPPTPAATTTSEPPATDFLQYEASTRNCFDPNTTYSQCEVEGVSFVIVDGVGTSVRSSGGSSGNLKSEYYAEQASNGMVGFYSTRPLYLVDPGFPGSNDGVLYLNDTWLRFKLGDDLISSANRPAATVTCPLTQLNNYEQETSNQANPKDNFYTVSDYALKAAQVLTVYPSGDVWIDTEFYEDNFVYALEWACQWPMASAAASKQSVTLDWTAPTAPTFIDHESNGKSCVEPNGATTVLCDVLGQDYKIVDGDGSESNMKAEVVTMGDLVGFYSSQPVYVVDPGYPSSNTGHNLTKHWLRVSMGAALIPAALRPDFAVTCVGIQLSTYGQYADLAASPKNNLYTAYNYYAPKSTAITIYPTGDVWLETNAVDDNQYNLVWEWACQWPLPSATTTQELTLSWAMPSATSDLDHENAEMSCYNDEDDQCDILYPKEFNVTVGDGSTDVTKAKVVRQGDFVGFYSSQFIYFVDEDYPSSNGGISYYGFTKLSLGPAGFIPAAYRPTTPTTCLASLLSTYDQDEDLQSPPRDNLYTGRNSKYFELTAVLRINADGSVWADLESYDEDINFVLSWSCQWRSPSST